MTEKIADIMNFIFNKLNISDYKQLPLTFYGRYDLLYDKNDNKFKVVEINSETPS
jgi:glutathionylspermidine synthase